MTPVWPCLENGDIGRWAAGQAPTVVGVRGSACLTPSLVLCTVNVPTMSPEWARHSQCASLLKNEQESETGACQAGEQDVLGQGHQALNSAVQAFSCTSWDEER